MEDKDGEAITGRVARYKALSTELLSAVLTPPTAAAAATCTACGGTAAVSMASASNSIHVTVAVSGLVASRGAGVDVETFVVRLETLETASHPSRVIEELVTVQKPQEVSRKLLLSRPRRHSAFEIFGQLAIFQSMTSNRVDGKVGMVFGRRGGSWPDGRDFLLFLFFHQWTGGQGKCWTPTSSTR